jgi:hypothetical protein
MEQDPSVDLESPEGVEDDEQHNNGAADNFLEQLRNKRRSIGTSTELKLQIPGYDTLLWCEYRRLDWEELKRIAEKAQNSRSPRKELLAACDTLIEACNQFLILKDGKLEPMNNAYPEFGDEPVRYDDRLASALGFEIDRGSPARSCVLRAFGGNGAAVTAHQGDLVEWIQSSRADDDEDFSTS